MGIRIVNYSTIVVLLAILFGCANSNSDSKSTKIDHELSADEGVISFIPNDYKDEEIIFYNLFSPVELTYLVSKKEAYYNSSLINPINNITKYLSSDKIALNLGVYGADISYLWMFNQSQQSLSYRTAIIRLTDKLEIPREYVNIDFLTDDSNPQKFDSLVYIAKVSYLQTDKFLKKSDRDYSASLILLGGWIETLYIATQMYDKPGSKLMAKIALQEYSLNSLISLLQISQNNYDMSEYLLLLKKLKKAYTNLNVKFETESLLIDTTNKHIKLKQGSEFVFVEGDFAEIKRIAKQIRDYIIQ